MIGSLLLLALVPAPTLADDELDELRTLAAVERFGEVVERGLPLVSADGARAEDARFVALVADALVASGSVDAAELLLLAARGRAEPSAAVELALVRIHLRRDQLTAALALLLDEGAPRWPGEADAWLALTRTWLRLGRADRAGPCARAYLERQPYARGAVTAWHAIGAAALAADENEAARAAYGESARLRRAHALVRHRRLQVSLAPDAAEPRLGLGVALLGLGDAHAARDAFRILAARHPGDARAFYHLGVAAWKLGNGAEADEHLGHAHELDPTHTNSLLLRGVVRLTETRLEDARHDFDVALRELDDAARRAAHLFIARAFYEAERALEARVWYSTYIELGGTSPLIGPR